MGSPTGAGVLVAEEISASCEVLEREDVERAGSQSFLYVNLLGMSVRHLPSGESRARAAYEKAISLDPHRPDTLYNLANLLKDDDHQRAHHLYYQSLRLNPWGADCWHNFGSNLTKLHFQEKAIQALKTSIFLDATVADVWCT